MFNDSNICESHIYFLRYVIIFFSFEQVIYLKAQLRNKRLQKVCKKCILQNNIIMTKKYIQ